MSDWNQVICNRCWVVRCATLNQLGRTPTRVELPAMMDCAFCGERTASGIFVRHDPRQTPYPLLGPRPAA